MHLLALAAIPFFSWENLLLCAFGLFVIAPIGINVGYHRMLTHRAFEAPKWLRYTLVTLGSLSAAGPPLYWAAQHRIHHRFSDTDLDPHNSRKGFWHSHVLHLFRVNEHEIGNASLIKYTPDLLREPYLVFLNKYWIWIALTTLPLLYIWGGVDYVLWGGFMRIALTWNVMWLVNSASHLWGYRNYDTPDNTVNCWWVGILAGGEGWHNNHHAYPSCAAHGHRWWELDFSYFLIRILGALGLAQKIVLPPERGNSC